MYLWIFQKKHYFSIIIEYGILIFEIHIYINISVFTEHNKRKHVQGHHIFAISFDNTHNL